MAVAAGAGDGERVLGTMGRSRGDSVSGGVGVGCAAAVVGGGAGGGWGGGGGGGGCAAAGVAAGGGEGEEGCEDNFSSYTRRVQRKFEHRA